MKARNRKRRIEAEYLEHMLQSRTEKLDLEKAEEFKPLQLVLRKFSTFWEQTLKRPWT